MEPLTPTPNYDSEQHLVAIDTLPMDRRTYAASIPSYKLTFEPSAQESLFT